MSTLDEIFGDGSDRKKAKGKSRGAGEMSPYELLKDKTGDDLLLAALTYEKTTKSAGGGKLAADQAKGIRFSEDGKALLEYPYDLRDDGYEIPEGITTIGKGAFNSARVKHVVFPGSLKRIEAEAFMSAELQEAILPEGLAEIGDAAFWCSGVSEVSLPRSLAKVGEFAFYGCISLRKLITCWDEPHCDTMKWRETISDAPSGEGEAPISVFSKPRVFGNCPRVTEVAGCESLKELVREYQRRSANPLPEDTPDNWRDYAGC